MTCAAKLGGDRPMLVITTSCTEWGQGASGQLLAGVWGAEPGGYAAAAHPPLLTIPPFCRTPNEAL